MGHWNPSSRRYSGRFAFGQPLLSAVPTPQGDAPQSASRTARPSGQRPEALAGEAYALRGHPSWLFFRMLLGKKYGRGWRYGYLDGFMAGYEAAISDAQADEDDRR
jgi:hypothetical protein